MPPVLIARKLELDLNFIAYSFLTMPQMKVAPSKTNSSRSARLGFSLAALITGAVILLAWQARSEKTAASPAPAPVDPVVATINNETVSAAEYRLVMERKTSTVYNYFKQQYGMDDHLGYWSESSGPQGPLAKWREVVQEELVRIKVYQGQAKSRGLVQDTTFANFQKEFEHENARRSAAQRAGQPIYGPPQYRIASYYYIRVGDLVYKLKQAMAKEAEPRITDSEIKEFYKANKAAFGDQSLDEARRAILTDLSSKEAGRELDAFRASAKVEINAPLLQDIVPRLDPEPANQNKLAAQQR